MTITFTSIGINLLGRHFQIWANDRHLGEAHFRRTDPYSGVWSITGEVERHAYVRAGSGGNLPSIEMLPNTLAEIDLRDCVIKYRNVNYDVKRHGYSRFTVTNQGKEIAQIRARTLWRKFTCDGGSQDLEFAIFCCLLAGTICYKHVAANLDTIFQSKSHNGDVR